MRYTLCSGRNAGRGKIYYVYHFPTRGQFPYDVLFSLYFCSALCFRALAYTDIFYTDICIIVGLTENLFSPSICVRHFWTSFLIFVFYNNKSPNFVASFAFNKFAGGLSVPPPPTCPRFIYFVFFGG